LTAAGRQNALSVIAASDRGTMLDASAVFYMNKLVAGPEAVGVVDIRKPIGENIRALAKAKGKPVDEMVIAVLDRPRHEQLIADIRATGAGTRLLLDGDVAGGIHAARYGSRIDMCVGIGGSPEGIVTTCAVKGLGGIVQGVLQPRDGSERERGEAAGLKFDHVYEMNELVRSENTFFVATGVTDGGLLQGVRKKGPVILAQSLVIRGKTGTVRHVNSEYLADRWL
jgi:fructose-1,6-bisphosphatase II